jgi:Protein of unknown function (DUF2917)
MTAQNALSPNTLPAGQARTLRPQQAGVFRVTQGTVWATLDGPHAGHTQVQGDQFLQAGDTVHLQRGQRMVIEPVGAANTVCFSWVPAEVPVLTALQSPPASPPARHLPLPPAGTNTPHCAPAGSGTGFRTAPWRGCPAS